MKNDKRERIVIRKTKPNISKEEKAGFALVVVTGSLAILLGTFFMVRHLQAPFDFNYVGPRFLSGAEQRQVDLEAQKNKDTDEDGLSDYDELYIFRTSPYLKDTDGDGISDFEEVQAGSDPSCVGDNCNEGAGNVYDTPKETFDNLPPQPSIDYDALLEPINPEDFEENNPNSEIEGLTAQEVRDLLLAEGASEEQLAGISDEQIMTLYRETLDKFKTQGN